MTNQYMKPEEALERLMNKVLPVPKTKREYQLLSNTPIPKKAYSWVPHGQIGKGEYEKRLESFANEIKAIDEQKTTSIKYGSRGWGYLLEGLGKITKDEFDSCQKAINDCRKLGFLPIDFVKEDQDESRRFSGIINASNPTGQLKHIQYDIKETLRNLPESTTDFWDGEKYYLMMCVEKGDIKDLFEPICKEYHVPIISSKGWAPILLRSHIIDLSQKAEERGLTPVLLLFYDHDPAGLKISDTFRKNLEDLERGTGWSPDPLIIERFGLNSEDIEKYGLTWIENLKTSSGKEAKSCEDYIEKFGKRKCEANALFKNDETLEAGETICRTAIEKFYGKDALERFKEKEEDTKESLPEIYDTPIWKEVNDKINEIIVACAEKEIIKVEKVTIQEQEKELDFFIPERFKGEYTKYKDLFRNKNYSGQCPRCGHDFRYSVGHIGELVRCRKCNAVIRLKLKEETNQ